ncbi:MFS transporter [Granulicoccus phenolivorans]|uniref:MFS transporter n=1 Tax=Granulicoccus phenolivorans TaxID=266854 RepID=UPI0004108F93|nr:MFS transporter [Granulicoccus phenolivorans]
MSPAASQPVTSTPAERRRAIASSFLGSTVEYYDFLLYAAAAGLVFPKLFFQGVEPGVATMLSYLTLFTGYLARPLGGMLFGHFGDKFGRKNMLVITLLMMGLVSIAVGLMPTAQTIGVAAPILLTVLRVIQGFAVGGEWAGAMLMSMEHSKSGSKGLGASISVAGAPFGAVLSTLVLALFSTLPQDQFLSWGWRIPFLLSAVIVIIGLFMRTRVTESPEFEQARREGKLHTGLPIAKLFKEHGGQVFLGSFAVMASLFIQGLLASFMVPHVVATGVATQSETLLMLTASNVLHVFAIPFFAWLSDKFGRKQVMLAGAALCIVLVFPMFALFNSGNFWLVALGFIVGNPLMQASMYGPVGAYLSELFDTGSRYSGVSATYQLGSVLGAGLAPIVGQWLVVPKGSSDTTKLAIYIIIAFLISALAVILSRSHASRQSQHTAAETFTESEAFQG